MTTIAANAAIGLEFAMAAITANCALDPCFAMDTPATKFAPSALYAMVALPALGHSANLSQSL